MHLAKLSLSFLPFQIVESVQCSPLAIYSAYFFQVRIITIPRKVKMTNTDCQVSSPSLVMVMRKQINRRNKFNSFYNSLLILTLFLGTLSVYNR